MIEDLSPEKHRDTIFRNAYGMLRNIGMTFQFMGKGHDEEDADYIDKAETGLCRGCMVSI